MRPSSIQALVFFLIVVFAVVFPFHVNAQITKQFNIATTLTIADKEAVDGDIMSLGEQNETLVLTKKAYDERMYGVLVASPVMVYRTTDDIPVARAGEVYVNITTANGTVAVGDYVTSSDIPGKGQKATELSGYMAGIALQSFDGSNGTDVTANGQSYKLGKIKIAVGIGPASPAIIKAAGGIFGTIKRLATVVAYNISTSKQLERFIRYLLAALVAIIAIIVSYRFFGKNVTKGIEAIGRNPLARVTIQSMIIVNVVLIFVVCLGGILLSLVIISL